MTAPDLPTFLAQRYDEQEADARVIAAGVDMTSGGPFAVDHPAYVLADLAAKRRIVSLFSPTLADEMRAASGEWDEVAFRGDQALRALASVFADHPDFRPEWKL